MRYSPMFVLRNYSIADVAFFLFTGSVASADSEEAFLALQQKYQKAGQEYEKVIAHMRKGA
jgi:hypothetical protein